jgi:hypothetical protein
MARGDHIFVKRFGYTHHGIDCGNGTVIHYTGEVGQKSEAAIRRTPLEAFLKNGEVHVRPYGACDDADAVVERAESRVGEDKYHLVFNNCEHFATWCKTGSARSEQVKDVTSTAGGAAGGGAAVAVGIGVVSAAGEAAGLSGAGIMSGLAATGGVVGSGAVAGIGVLGAAPAVISAGAMCYVLRDDPVLHEAEREARRAGRWATVGGAAAGSAGAIGAVTLSGAVAGLSGAGITSGLAAVGSAVGGGMVAGVAVTAALPAVLAAGAGYGVYRIWKAVRKSKQESPAAPTSLSDRFEQALVYAARKHAKQQRKGTTIPYVAHLLGVANIALTYGADEDEAIAALLHDAIEDQGGAETRKEIRDLFGDRVVEIVNACSDSDVQPKPPWEERKKAYIAHLRKASVSVRLVSAADKLDNARAILADYRMHGEALWSRFKGGRDGTLWYYRSLVDMFRQFGLTPVIVELSKVVAEIEQLAANSTSAAGAESPHTR